MPTIATTLPDSVLDYSALSARYLYRLSIDKYEAMVRSGVFKRDRIELIEGVLVAKMPEDPPHASICEMIRDAIESKLPVGWHVRGEKPVRIPSRASLLEPDLTAAQGIPRDYLERHPEPSDVALIVEVADSSLSVDRKLMSRVYGGGEIPTYWIVNVVEGQVEVYSVPSGPSEPIGYRHREVYTRGQEIPLVIAGAEVGRISVADLLP